MAKIRLTLVSKNESAYTPGQVQLQFGVVVKADPNQPPQPVIAPLSSANLTIDSAAASGLVVGTEYDITFTAA